MQLLTHLLWWTWQRQLVSSGACRSRAFCVEDSLPADDYQADKTVFLELLKKHDLAIPTLIKQLQETAYHIDKTCVN